jgi:[methyl-Co(III) methanol-specific corrinoid protein]:coenzyme M methyltransferase
VLLGPVLYEKFVLPLEREIISRINGPVVLHVCGDTHSIIDMMCETGAAGISIEEKVDLKPVVEIAHAKEVKVFGNVAAATLGSTPEAVFRESILALEKGTDFLCPGCGLAPNTPLENILQLKRARDVFFRVSSA